MLVRNPFTHDSRVEKEAHTLRDAGYEVVVICEWRPGLARRETVNGIEVRRVPRRHARIPVLRFFSYRGDLIRALEAAHPAILHAHDANALDEVGTVAARRAIPFVYDSHELWLGRTRHKHSRPYHAVMQTWHRLIESRHVRRAAAVMTVSKPIADHLAARYALGSVRVVPNYPQLAASPGRRDLRELPDAQGIPADAPIVLHIGLYVNDRGVEQVMEALRQVPNAHFVLLGAGVRSARASVEATALGIADRVHPLQRVPTDQVIDYATSATVGVAAIIPNALSYAWALPNKLFQYMAAGLPVVVSDLPEMGALVREAGAGLTVDGRSPAQIAEALRALLENPALREEMGARGRDAVRHRYNWQTSAAELLDVYAAIPVPTAAPGAGDA